MLEYHDARVRVRYAETDQMGVVYHANFLIWFEVGRVELMRALGVDPMRKLVTPRLYATIVMLFFLTIVADFCGILGGAAVTVFMNHQNGGQYFSQAYQFLAFPDILQGLVKPLCFGFIIASIGCFYGMRTTGGTQGVGQSTIKAVVFASVLIIFVDLLISTTMVSIFSR